MREFGITEVGRESLKSLDPYLGKGYQNIVVLLLDGMGSKVMERSLEGDGFFLRRKKADYHSVFPPTTVAATTSIRSGLQPCEHSWLGWDCYFPQINKNVTVFTNTETGTSTPAADYHVAQKYCGYETVVEKINRHVGQAYEVMPFEEPFPQTMEAICERIEELCRKPGKKYIYAYWNEPDKTMHETGCYSEETKRVVRGLEEQVETLCRKLNDALVIVTADHGLVDTKNVSLTDYPKICECLKWLPSIEPRALNLFVKEEKKDQFEQEFEKAFGGQFLLMTKDQVLESQIFGDGTEHPNFRGMIGDYLAIGTGDVTIFSDREEAESMKGVHAGLLETEMQIPLIVEERA